MTPSDALHARVGAFIDQSLAGATGESFDALACDIARFQARAIEPVARLFAAHGVDAGSLPSADAIPAVPSDAFRLRRIAAHEAFADERVFETSGTTTEARGRHPMRTTATYRKAALAWGKRMLFPDRVDLDFIGLVADERRAPSSSLSFMLARFAEDLGGSASWHWDGEALDVAGVSQALSRGRPALIAGTSFAFVHLLDSLGDRKLPQVAGTRVMQTGGFKGRSRAVDAEVLRSAIAAALSIDRERVIAEYGMTELSSQLYQSGDDERYRPPPWLRVTAVDPETLAPLAPGARGIARFADLANVDSAVAVQTADMITAHPDGAITLHGRSAGAPPRGCSLDLEHLLS